MNITIHAGHAPKGKSQHGAVGIVDESERAREIVTSLIKIASEEYFEAIHDITRDDLPYSLKDLKNRANAICNQKSDLNISIHLNSHANPTSNGTEVLYYNPALREISEEMSAEIANALGIKNRGSKNRKDLYFLKATTARAILIESFFCTNQDDCNSYINNGNEKIARAILKVLEKTGNITRKKQQEEVEPDSDSDSDSVYFVQVGAFKVRRNAERYKKELNDKYGISAAVKKS